MQVEIVIMRGGGECAPAVIRAIARGPTNLPTAEHTRGDVNARLEARSAVRRWQATSLSYLTAAATTEHVPQREHHSYPHSLRPHTASAARR